MKIGGIIAEYNPFHNGHLYQIDTLKREYGVTHVVVVMSGNYVQRGDVAIVDKFKRSKMAIYGGADLVLELPVVYALSSAEYFANAGVHILDSLNCVDLLSFGSTADIDTIKTIAELSNSIRNSPEVLNLIKLGYTFPMALSTVMSEYSEVLNEPNNVLGLEYVRAILKHGSNIVPTTITRKHVMHHSTKAVENFASASYIRSSIAEGLDIKDYLTEYSYNVIQSSKTTNIDSLEQAILYRCRTATIEQIANTPDVSQGLEYRISKAIRQSTSVNQLLNAIKTKRYTLARLRRILLNLLLNITKQDLETPPPYARVLAMNRKGIEALSKAKLSATIPIGTSLAKLEKSSTQAERLAYLETTSTDIYNLSNGSICGLDYTTPIKPID